MMRYINEKLDALEQFGADVIHDRHRGKVGGALSVCLKGVSWLFWLVLQARLLFYKQHILKSRSLGCLVVSVGNLTVGGTGKTPVVEMFARSLAARGRRVAILSRGYKSKAEPMYTAFWRWLTHDESPPPKVVSDGTQILLDSEVAGDEPFMLAKNLPGVVVLVDKDRVKAGRYAIDKFGADTLILDDGFQYLRLKPRLNLLLVDKTNPFGNGWLLPRGVLREPIQNMKRASYVLLTKSDGISNEGLERRIRAEYPGVEIIECAHKPQYLQEVGGQGKQALLVLKGARVAAFSAIAKPDSFEGFLENRGAELVSTKRFLDHHRFTTEELVEFFERAEDVGADMIVTTEKDAVRVPHYLRSKIPMYFLRLEVEILKGSEDFENAVSAICFPKNKMRATRPPFVV